MENLKIEWKDDVAYIGKVKVGSVEWDGARPRDDPKSYATFCTLPQIKKRLQNYETKEDAMTRVEEAVNHWLKMLTQNLKNT